MTNKHPRLSVIVSSYSLERLRDVSDLLDSVVSQDYHDFEVVYVVEGSAQLSDRVNRIVKERHLTDVLVCRNEGKPGLSEARNIGIEHSNGKILAFVDDDVILAKDWAGELVRTFDDEAIIGVTGSATPLWEDPSDSWLPKELDWLLSCTGWCEWNRVIEVRNVWGFNMAFRKEAFETCGAFPTQFGYHRGPMAEDLGFSMMVRNRTHKRIVFNPNVKVQHKVHQYRLSWKFIAERSYWIGHSRRMLSHYYRDENEDVLSPENQLLKRIVTRLLPSALSNLRILTVTLAVLLFTGLGYVVPFIPLEGSRASTKE